MSALGQEVNAHLPGSVAQIANARGRYNALKQGSVGPVMSDLETMQANERKQHEQNYIYAHGHNDGSVPLGTPSF